MRLLLLWDANRLLGAGGQVMVTIGLCWENGVCMVYILDEYERVGLAVGSIHSYAIQKIRKYRA